jgi:bacteriorhodopsin
MKDLLSKSLSVSIFFQVLSITISLFGLTLNVSPKDQILVTALRLETLVSAIQFSFYTWYAYHFRDVAEATLYRYHDWIITTPLMLLTTMIYFDYNNNPEKETTLESFWEEHRTDILLVFAFNAFMLIFGYLFEIGLLDLLTSNTLGFAGLIGSFYVIYTSFVSKNLAANLPLFGAVSAVWGSYGVAATLSPTLKNVFYNLIDAVSKNFYGIFLTYIVYQKSYSAK